MQARLISVRRCGAPILCALLATGLITSCTSSSGHAGRPTGASASGSVSRGAHGAGPSGPTSGASSSSSGSRGGIDKTVAPGKLTTAAPVPLTRSSTFGHGVTLKLTSVKATKVKAQLPGELSGPALKLTFSITNDGRTAVDLDAFVATVLDDRKVPAPSVTSGLAHPLRGDLGAGRTRTGTYLFTVPVSHRTPITVTASYTAQRPILLFVGNA